MKSKRPRNKATLATGTAPAMQITNALPNSTGTTRVSPQRMWSTKRLETMAQNRNRVEVSRFLQEEIPVVGYCINTLPVEAIGKGIGLKSISNNPEFKARATAFFASWANSTACDLRKESTFYELQPRWLSAILGDGSAVVQKVKGDESTAGWKLADKSRRRCQFQTFTRDQLTNPPKFDPKSEAWNEGLLYNALDQLAKVCILLSDERWARDAKVATIDAAFVSHLKDKKRFNQGHGSPAIYSSNADLLDFLDLKAARKHSAKVRAALLGITKSLTGQVPNAMQAVMTGTQTGTPAADTGKRYVEIHDGAVMIPTAVNEDITFFTSTGEAVPFTTILESLTHPFVFNFGIPPEWIFSMGSLGGVSARAIFEKVRRAYERLRALLYPHLQWCWEFVIGDAMLPGGPLAEFATVEDWNEIDFVCDPDPSGDLHYDHKAAQERISENQETVEDAVERRTGGSGQAVRHASIAEKFDNFRYAMHLATGEPMESIKVPASLATIIALGPRISQAASGIISSLNPESIAAELKQMDDPDAAA